MLKATENLAMKLSEEELAKRAAAHRLFECPPDRVVEIPDAEVFPGPRVGFYWRDIGASVIWIVTWVADGWKMRVDGRKAYRGKRWRS